MLSSLWKSFSSQEITKARVLGLQSLAALTRAEPDRKQGPAVRSQTAPASSMYCNHSTCGIRRHSKHLNGLQLRNSMYFSEARFGSEATNMSAQALIFKQSLCCWTQNWVPVHVLPAPQPHSTKSAFNCPILT